MQRLRAVRSVDYRMERDAFSAVVLLCAGSVQIVVFLSW